MKLMLIMICVILGMFAPANSTKVMPFASGVAMNDPLLDSHLIIRGRVLEIATDPSTLGAFGLVPLTDRAAQQSIQLSKVLIAVDDVLKGSSPGAQVTLTMLEDTSMLQAGRVYVLCARWRVVRGVGNYLAGRNLGLYVEEGKGHWKKLSNYEPESSISDEGLRSRIKEADLEHVVESADVAVRGVVRASWVAQYEVGDGRHGTMRHYRLEIREVFKGEGSGSFIEFVIPLLDGATYVPNWARYTPEDIKVGDEWLLFLRRGEQGLYPFGGPNSLLKVEGKRLIYDSVVPYPRSLDDAQRLIRAEVSRVED